MTFNESLPRFYSDWAEGYADQFGQELDSKPLDRDLLSRIAHLTFGTKLLEVGCGSGHIANFLDLAMKASGPVQNGSDQTRLELKRVEGVDIAPGMISVASTRYPNVRFRQADFFDLPYEDSEFGGIVAFYSLIHAEKSRLTDAFAELCRVLKPNGYLLASFHEGDSFVLKDSVVFNFFTREEIEQAVTTCGLLIVDLISRRSYTAENGDHNRLYVIARRGD